MADLLLQLFFLGLVGEDGSPLFHELRLPLHDGVRVSVVDAGKFHQALFPLDGLQGCLKLNLWGYRFGLLRLDLPDEAVERTGEGRGGLDLGVALCLVEPVIRGAMGGPFGWQERIRIPQVHKCKF